MSANILEGIRSQITDIRDQALAIRMSEEYVREQRNTLEDYKSIQGLKLGIAQFATDLGSAEHPDFSKYEDLIQQLGRIQDKYVVALEKNPLASQGLREISFNFKPALPKIYITKKNPALVQKVKNAVRNNPWRTLGAMALVGTEVYCGFPVTISALSTISNGISSIANVANPILSGIWQATYSTVETTLSALGFINPMPPPPTAWWKVW